MLREDFYQAQLQDTISDISRKGPLFIKQALESSAISATITIHFSPDELATVSYDMEFAAHKYCEEDRV